MTGRSRVNYLHLESRKLPQFYTLKYTQKKDKIWVIASFYAPSVRNICCPLDFFFFFIQGKPQGGKAGGRTDASNWHHCDKSCTAPLGYFNSCKLHSRIYIYVIEGLDENIIPKQPKSQDDKYRKHQTPGSRTRPENSGSKE